MEILTEVYKDLLDRDVTVFSGAYRFSGDCDAVTVKLDGNFGVFLDIDRIRTLRQEKEAVVHEWAHIRCDATYGVNAPAALRQKAETRAVREEIQMLLPFDRLRDAMAQGRTTPAELAEFFDVSEELVQAAMAYYTGPCGLKFRQED